MLDKICQYCPLHDPVTWRLDDSFVFWKLVGVVNIAITPIWGISSPFLSDPTTRLKTASLRWFIMELPCIAYSSKATTALVCFAQLCVYLKALSPPPLVLSEPNCCSHLPNTAFTTVLSRFQIPRRSNSGPRIFTSKASLTLNSDSTWVRFSAGIFALFLFGWRRSVKSRFFARNFLTGSILGSPLMYLNDQAEAIWPGAARNDRILTTKPRSPAYISRYFTILVSFSDNNGLRPLLKHFESSFAARSYHCSALLKEVAQLYPWTHPLLLRFPRESIVPFEALKRPLPDSSFPQQLFPLLYSAEEPFGAKYAACSSMRLCKTWLCSGMEGEGHWTRRCDKIDRVVLPEGRFIQGVSVEKVYAGVVPKSAIFKNPPFWKVTTNNRCKMAGLAVEHVTQIFNTCKATST